MRLQSRLHGPDRGLQWPLRIDREGASTGPVMLRRWIYLRNAATAVVACSMLGFVWLWWKGDPPSETKEQPPAPQAVSAWATYQQTVQPFFAKHCLECHDETARGGVRLDAFADRATLVQGLPTLERAAG